MDTIYFFIRHTPFWAVPLMVIGLEFGYMYWLKGKKSVGKMFASVSFVCFLFILYYYLAGGPEHSVKQFIRLINL